VGAGEQRRRVGILAREQVLLRVPGRESEGLRVVHQQAQVAVVAQPRLPRERETRAILVRVGGIALVVGVDGQVLSALVDARDQPGGIQAVVHAVAAAAPGQRRGVALPANRRVRDGDALVQVADHGPAVDQVGHVGQVTAGHDLLHAPAPERGLAPLCHQVPQAHVALTGGVLYGGHDIDCRKTHVGHLTLSVVVRLSTRRRQRPWRGRRTMGSG